MLQELGVLEEKVEKLLMQIESILDKESVLKKRARSTSAKRLKELEEENQRLLQKQQLLRERIKKMLEEIKRFEQ